MPISLSKFLDINSSELIDRGSFDPILDLDTRLFIDPYLLQHSEILELENSYEKFQKHFLKIIRLLKASNVEGGLFWRNTDTLMRWNEARGLCIGYSSKGTAGSGIGPELRARLLRTAKEIIIKGNEDPELFELVGLLEDDFGPDRISDMTANIIKDDLIAFTKSIFRDLEVPIEKKFNAFAKNGLPINPFNKTPLLLVPQFILRDLPVALEWSNMDIIAAHNAELRAKVNGIIGATWREAVKSHKKEDLKEVLLEYPKLMDDLIGCYKKKPAKPYNFIEDRAGEYIWYPVAQELVKNNPLKISLSAHPSIDEVDAVVSKICEKFKTLIENNGLSSLLYNSNGTLKSETAAQLLF